MTFRLDDFANNLYRLIDSELPAAAELRRQLHHNPCVSGQEQPTTDAVISHIGLDFTGVAETGAYRRLEAVAAGSINGCLSDSQAENETRPAPAVALRGELDALPVTEQTGVPWAATNGAMHACGHDVHLAGLAALVRAAKQLDLPVAMLPILQPREESYPSGASDIKDSGLFERENVRFAIGAHVHPGVASGSIATGTGAVNAAAGELHFKITGKSGHGAYPHKSFDVVAPTAQIALGINEVARRTLDPMQPALVSVGQLLIDSGAPNVLPDTGTISATIRTTGLGDAEQLVGALRDFASQVAAAYGASAELQYIEGEPVLFNDGELCAVMDQRLTAAGLQVAPPMRSLGADDFSFFSAAVPSVMAFVGTGRTSDQVAAGQNAEQSEFVPLHDPRFLPDDDAIRRVAYTLAAGYLAAAELLLAESN